MLDKNIQTIIDKITKINGNSNDITSRIIKIKTKTIGYIFLESTASDEKIGDIVLAKENAKYLSYYFWSWHTTWISNIRHSVYGKYCRYLLGVENERLWLQ